MDGSLGPGNHPAGLVLTSTRSVWLQGTLLAERKMLRIYRQPVLHVQVSSLLGGLLEVRRDGSGTRCYPVPCGARSQTAFNCPGSSRTCEATQGPQMGICWMDGRMEGRQADIYSPAFLLLVSEEICLPLEGRKMRVSFSFEKLRVNKRSDDVSSLWVCP